MSKFERRALSRADLDIREAPSGVTEISGYVAVFDEVAHGEVIKPGAFTKTLQERADIRAYWSHNMAMPIGRTTNGTLELRQDPFGLWGRIVPNTEISWGRDALEAVRSGLVNQFSFGMRIINATSEIEDGAEVTAIREVALYEVSPVAEPWYEGTSATARNAFLGHETADTTSEAGQDPATTGCHMAKVRRRKLQLEQLMRNES